jgi:hypothetical protein
MSPRRCDRTGSRRASPTAKEDIDIIGADDIDSAIALAKGCPALAGDAAVIVSETFPVM